MKSTSRKRIILFAVVFLFTGMLSSVREIPAAQGYEKVHTLYWRAILRKSVKVGGKTVKSGTAVTVVKRSYTSKKKSQVSYKGKRFYVPNSWLSFRGDLATIATKGDYSKKTKERFANRLKKASSKTSWFIWVSLDKQRVNVFHGSKGKWKYVKSFACSTGKSSTPTATGWHTIDFKKMWVDGCKYYTEVNGSGIHRWPGTMNKKIMGKHTVSHGCIRLYEASAKWVYTHIPKKTTVLIY